MKRYETLIAEIRTEACELADKLKRLEVFMMSEDFCKISPEQKGLLEQQYDLMAKYKVILVKRAHRINYEHANQSTKEKIKEFVEEREESEKRPPALTFDTNPEICEKCTHHTKAWSTCHDCVKGSNFTDLKIINCAACVHYKEESCTHKVLDGDDSCFEKRLEPHEFSALEYEAHLKAKGDKLCSDCYYFKDMPNGPRCKMCDNGSCWEKRERH